MEIIFGLIIATVLFCLLYMILGIKNPKSEYETRLDDLAQEKFIKEYNQAHSK